MTKPKFNNRENEKVTLGDGRVVFLARSTAVVGTILCIDGDTTYALMVERGEKVDNSGKWCMPCGYLDWDEDFSEAVRREVFEETGLDISSLHETHQVLHSDLESPYYVESSPNSHRQNVSCHFGILIKGPVPPVQTSDGLESGEISRIEWVNITAIPTNENLEASGLADYFAFDHNDKLNRFVRQVQHLLS